MAKAKKKKTMKQCRESTLLAQRQIAEALGITLRHYQRLEAANNARKCYHNALLVNIGWTP